MAGPTRKLEEVALEALADLRGGACSVKVYEAYEPGWIAWLGGARATPRMIGISGNPQDCYPQKDLDIDKAYGGIQKHGAVVLSPDVRSEYRRARGKFLGQ
jgi:hypothetical protein